MSPLDCLAVCAGKMLARIEMLLPGIFDDDALEETVLVETEAESEVHEPPRAVAILGIDERDTLWKSVVGTLWRWDSGRWWHRAPWEDWMPASYDFWPQDTGPFVAVDIAPPVMDWHGWAVPAILEVLAEHHPIYSEANRFIWCIELGHPAHGRFDDEAGWREHVAPLIADRIACDPERALNALYTLRNDRLHR